MDTENREKMGDRRRMREAAGRRYLTAFDIQSTPELAPEAILHEWPGSGTSYAVAHFWDISSGGPVLGHPLHNVAHFRASCQLTLAVVFRVELTESHNRIFYN